MEHLLTPESLISLLILIVLEVVLGIDNVIFVSIIMNRMRVTKDKIKAKRWWMIIGILSRTILLMALGWLLAQKGKSIFSVFGKTFDLSEIVMLAGGLFLIYKSVREIHIKLEGEEIDSSTNEKAGLSFAQGMAQIMLIDAVFSFDSIITAGGTAKHVEIMVIAVLIAMIIMFKFSSNISNFIHQHPTLKMLALSFLVMIGLSLVIEGWDSDAAHQLHLKNYIYFGMAFSFVVELLNMSMRNKMKRHRVVELNEPVIKENGSENESGK